MVIHFVELTVKNATAENFYDFMITPNNEKYTQWWPEEHLQFYIVKSGNNEHYGDEVFYDEYLGEKRRLAFNAVVITADRPNKIAWQMKKAGVRLPAVLSLELFDSADGLNVKHALRIGFSGVGKILDPFIKLYVTKSFRDALERHCRIEWPKLAEYLSHQRTE